MHNQILSERHHTHGDFTDNARTAQQLKAVARAGVKWSEMTDVEREAIEMILHKIARAVNGNPHFQDHYDDMVGYAQLVSNRLSV